MLLIHFWLMLGTCLAGLVSPAASARSLHRGLEGRMLRNVQFNATEIAAPAGETGDDILSLVLENQERKAPEVEYMRDDSLYPIPADDSSDSGEDLFTENPFVLAAVGVGFLMVLVYPLAMVFVVCLARRIAAEYRENHETPPDWLDSSGRQA